MNKSAANIGRNEKIILTHDWIVSELDEQVDIENPSARVKGSNSDRVETRKMSVQKKERTEAIIPHL